MDPTSLPDRNAHSINSPQEPRRDFLKALPLYASLLSANLVAASPIDVSQRSDGFLLTTPSYSVRYRNTTPVPTFDIFQEGRRVFLLPAVSGLGALNSDEHLTAVTPGQVKNTAADRYSLEITAQSSIWQDRIFRWTFFADHIEFAHLAKGPSRLGRCYFLSNGISAPWANGTSPGVAANTTIFAEDYFSPAVNLADQHYFTIAQPQSVGIAPADPAPTGYHPVDWTGDFAPPPLFLSFHKANAWISVGIGAQPGSYLFNSLEYTGSRYAGASFYVDYLGYNSAADGFSSPVMALHFGYDEYDTLKSFVDWLDTNNFSTRRKSKDVPWHHRPIFCGWGEQENQTRLHPAKPSDFCTQANYETWIAALEARGTSHRHHRCGRQVATPLRPLRCGRKQSGRTPRALSHGNTQPDDAYYFGSRHITLKDSNNPCASCKKAVPSLATSPTPAIRKCCARALSTWYGFSTWTVSRKTGVSGVTTKPDAQLKEPVIGIEFERRFQAILYDEAHRWKPDAMIETQTPNPLFRESSDILRLNDIWYGARNVTAIMRRRARIAHIAGWPLVDCDDASSTDYEEWWTYMQAQPQIGIPSLYVVSRMKTTLEDIPQADWTYLAALWKQYLETLGG